MSEINSVCCLHLKPKLTILTWGIAGILTWALGFTWWHESISCPGEENWASSELRTTLQEEVFCSNSAHHLCASWQGVYRNRKSTWEASTLPWDYNSSDGTRGKLVPDTRGGGPQPSTTLQCALGLIPGGQTHISLNQPDSTIPNHLHHHLAGLHSTLHQTFPHSLTQYSTASIFTILHYSAAELHRELTSIKVLASGLSGHHGHVRGHAGRHLWVRGHAVLHGGAWGQPGQMEGEEKSKKEEEIA